MDKQPNIVLILTDDQRYNTIHALGNKDIITPNLDRLAAMGTAFTQAHIPGGTSGAICMPSRAMLNTGRTLFHLQQEGQDIPKEHITLGQTLKANGYHCYGTGKWHNGPPAFTRSFHDGDNIFFGGMWDHWNVPTCYYDPTGKYDNVINFVSNFHQNNKPFEVNCDKFNPGKHSSELLTDTSIDFIRQYDGKEPFFLYTAYLAPHDPRTMPERFKKMYDPAQLTLPANCWSEHPFDFGVFSIRDEVLAAYPRDEKEVRQNLAEYYAMITHLDFEIGRLLDSLEEKGVLDNTLIILAGDNGLAVGCHGLMGKQNNYDHSIRVPLLIAGPHIPAGQRCESYVYLLDIYPTICSYLGITAPDSVEGISFSHLFTDPTAVTREKLYFAYNDLIRSVKDDRYKLIEYRTAIQRTQLFDLQKDPDELHDLYGQPGTEKITERLRDDLIEFKEKWDDEQHPFGQRFWQEN